jgi:hypothetical protein
MFPNKTNKKYLQTTAITITTVTTTKEKLNHDK